MSKPTNSGPRSSLIFNITLRWWRRSGIVFLLFALLASLATSLVHAQCGSLGGPSASWTDGNSNWNTSSNWSTGTVPNSSGLNVCIINGTNTTPVTVTLDTNASVASLQLASNNTLTFDTGTTLNVFGSEILNDGQIIVTGGSNANTVLGLANNVTLSGSGTVTLAYNGTGSGSAIILQQAGGLTLTNQSTIQGAGIIGNGGLAVANAANGTIDAGTSGQSLTLNGGGGVTNAGLVEATNGGTLVINTTVNNLNGNITADGGTVGLVATVQGGTLTSKNGGTLETLSAATLDGSSQGALTLSAGSTYSGGPGTTTNVLGTITNNGNMQITGGSNANTVLGLNANTTLQGGGTVTLAYNGTGSGSAIILQQAGGLTLTNQSTIQGAGIIGNGGLAVANTASGIINANTSGQMLTLNGGGGVSNAGLLEATNGGTLVINTTVSNGGASITAGNGSTVDIQNATVVGGALNNTGTGTLQTAGTAILDGSTGSGVITINGTYSGGPGSVTNILGTITNNGNMQITGGSNANTVLGLNANTTLQGGGTVTLAYNGTGSGAAIIQQQAGGLTLTNVNNTIHGAGVIGNGGLNLVNDAGGTINADTLGQALMLNGSGGVTNAGLLEATNGGTLSLSGLTVNNSGGTIEVSGAGSVMQFVNSATIQGGTLTSLSGGSLGVPNGNTITLDGSTQGALTLSTGSTYSGGPGSVTNILGTIINSGNMQITGGSNANTVLGLNANTTLQGGGTVTLAYNGTGSGVAIIQQQAGGLTLTNQSTIQGAGIIGNGGLTLVNDAGGTINANTSGQTLTLNGGGVSNAGLLEATSGGMVVSSGSLANSGTMDVEAGTTMSVATGNGAVSNTGLVNVKAGGTMTLASGLNYTQTAGDTRVNGAFGGSGAIVNINGGNLEGTGTITGTVTLTAGTITPGSLSPAAPGKLTINGTYTQTGGTFSELIGSTSNYGILNVSGAVSLTSASAGLGITLASGFTPMVGDTFTILDSTGSSLTGTFSHATSFVLDGYNWTLTYANNDAVLTIISQVSTGPTDVTATWSTPSGNWNTTTQWSCAPGPSNCVPNNTSSDVYETILNSPGHTLTLDNSGGPITVNTLALQAGTLNVNSGASLNLVNQPSGITDIPIAAGLILAGTFTTGGSTSALSKLGSVEGLLTLANGQTTSVTPGSGTLINSGTVNLQQTTALSVTGDLTNSGTITTGNGVSDTGHNTFSMSGTLTNNGSLALDGLGDSVSVGSLTNVGGINLNGPSQTLAVSGAFTNSNSGIFTIGGSTDVVSVAGAFVNNGGATVTLSGTSDTLSADSFTNNGAVLVGAHESLNATNTYTQNAGSTGVSGTLNAGTYQHNGGTTTVDFGGSINATKFLVSGDTTSVVQGTGTIAAAVTQSGGIIVPGSFTTNTPGVLVFNGTFVQTGGILDELINTTGNGLLKVNGGVTLGGSLDITFLNGFVPTDGATFAIMNYLPSIGLTGAFANAPSSGFVADGWNWDINYNFNGDEVLLTAASPVTATPEPSSWLLLLTGLLALAVYWRRTRAEATR